MLEFIAPEFRDKFVDKLLAGDESPLAVSGCKKDGTAFPVEFCSRIVPHGDGRINLTLFHPPSNPDQAGPQHPGATDQLGVFFDLAPGGQRNRNVGGRTRGQRKRSNAEIEKQTANRP